jgi:plastocyanin
VRSRTVIAVLAALGIAGAGCGEAAPTAPPASADPQAIEIVAENLASRPASMSVPAGAELQVRFDNRDAGVPHHIALMADAQFSTKLAETKIEVGPIVQELVVPGLVPGAYRFLCTIHPTMTTDLTVKG